MRVIDKKDLIAVISLVDDRAKFDLADMDLIIRRFGKEIYVEDGTTFVSCSEEMKRIRDTYGLTLGYTDKFGFRVGEREVEFDNPIEKLVYELELRHKNLLMLQDSEHRQDLYSEIEFVEEELNHYKRLLRR